MIKINLQLFAESEKTEKPTPKKRREARLEGQVVQSREVTTAVILFSIFIGLRVLSEILGKQLSNLTINIFKEARNPDTFLSINNLMPNSLKIFSTFAIIVLPFLGIAFLSSLIINYLQVGFLFTTKTLKLKLNRLNPVEGFKRIFSKRALMELFKSVFKIFLAVYVALTYIRKNLLEILQYPQMELVESLFKFSSLTYSVIIRVLGVLIILAILDYFFQWRQHEKNLMMTKQEIKEEYKQTEGDPLIKSKIKERQRRLAMSRMMQDIPKADVIITNPTHYAVAIKYDRDSFDAPYVLGKGIDLIAENIKKVAKENEIPIVENKPLAQAIYNNIEIGEMITEDLYEAVAEVLAYVYSLKDEFRGT
ncbi:MAG: flagellar biosynthesis protein FlhB [Tissierellia bacterium]|nr:flagellar biosynthesis protein FlhB [Tissierellia bacterium]